MSNEEGQRISTWVLVAFGLIGFLIGFVASLSLTPVVGTLLPLLFGVIGGGSGFFAAQKPAYSRAIGQSVAVLACLCLLGVVYGIHLREGLSWRCIVSACTASLRLDLPQDVTDPDSLQALFSIKTALSAMDADEGDKQRIFDIAVEHARTATTKSSEILSDLDDHIKTIAEMQAKVRGSVAEEEKRPVLKKK